MRKVTKIVIHVSDTPDTMDIGAAEIRKWHTDPPPVGNGWSDIGYHYVVRRDGEVEIGRLEGVVGAHVKGHNADSIGICWVGRNAITDVQKKALMDLTKQVMKHYNLSEKDVYGHKEFDPHKTCPNLDMDEFRRSL